MGAWIEILIPLSIRLFKSGRTPRWVRGLKFSRLLAPVRRVILCRTPRWVRGLKYECIGDEVGNCMSHPTMGAWIEIFSPRFEGEWISVAPHDGCVDWNNQPDMRLKGITMSHPTMGAWIEINAGSGFDVDKRSHPTMGAWIEIVFLPLTSSTTLVAPHDGCVDWNITHDLEAFPTIYVAPHDGCVDWNKSYLIVRSMNMSRTPRWVRGLKYIIHWRFSVVFRSHPTMGAWIEIYYCQCMHYMAVSRTPRWVRGLKFALKLLQVCKPFVAPHDGCVDWNLD